MKTNYLISKKDQLNMSCILYSKQNFLQAIFKCLPVKIIRHSERVRKLAGIMAAYVPKDLLPEDIDRVSYCFAVSKGAYYHDIGIYLAGNNIKKRPEAAEKLLLENGYDDIMDTYIKIVTETVRNYRERCDAQGYPDGLSTEKIPLHSAICSIADAVDMIMSTGLLKNKKAKRASAYIHQNSGIIFSHDAVSCFEQAQEKIFDIYTIQTSLKNV